MKTISYILFLAFISCFPEIGAQDETREPGCADCHSDLLEREMIHYPVEDGCDNCHNIPGEDHPDGEFTGNILADSLPGLCFLCHDASIHENTFRHNYGSGNSCISCHDPHGSGNSYLLKKQKRDLCMDCHSGMKKLDRYEFKHFPFEDDCGNCHASHSSPYQALLIDAYPAKLYAPGLADTFALCFLCHDQSLIVEETTTWATEFRDGNRNLHYLHLKGEKGRSCMLCHSVHASENEHMLATSVPFGLWDMPLGYTPLEKGGACNTGCHSQKTYLRE